MTHPPLPEEDTDWGLVNMPQRSCLDCGATFTPRNRGHRRCHTHEKHGRANRSPTTQAQDAEYRRERTRTLAGDPPCHWCGRPHADTADHLTPVAHGGGHQGNLVPACSSCNFARRDDSTWTPRRAGGASNP